MRPLLIALLGILGIPYASANVDPPKNLRVCVQFIEMPHPALTELLSGKAEPGDVVHTKAMALTKEGKAKLLESCMVMTPSGHRTTVESICEEIYPTDYEPNAFGPEIILRPPPPSPRPPLARTKNFETRNTGVTLEIDPTLDVTGQLIDLRFIPEIVALSRFDTIKKHKDQWGDATFEFPIFETWRTNTTVTLIPGKFELAATITPKPADLVPATLRKILVFARCDVVEVPR